MTPAEKEAAEIDAARKRHIEHLSETARMVAEAARAEAARQQAAFGTGDQG